MYEEIWAPGAASLDGAAPFSPFAALNTLNAKEYSEYHFTHASLHQVRAALGG